VIVLGAGSSHEANLPVGADLKTAISALLATTEDDFGDVRIEDYEIWSAINNECHESGGSLDEYVRAAESIAAAMPLSLSIDNYLEAHQDDQPKISTGKIAIAKAILDAEASSLLSSKTDNSDEIQFAELSNTWFVRFMQAATENIRIEDLDNLFGDVSIINFNYDRCIEHMVRESLRIYFDLEESRATQIAKSLYVFHPYGSVGRLPWQQSSGGVRFGSRKRGDSLLRIARSIKTFSERIDEGTELNEMKLRVANAEQIIFLGFAFHRQNLELMRPLHQAEPKKLYATTLGISSSDQRVVHKSLPQFMNTPENKLDISMLGAQCYQIIDEYWRTFTAYD
jgi:hypothetical protein